MSTVLLLLLACTPSVPDGTLERECRGGVAPSCQAVAKARHLPRVAALACAGGVVEACDDLLRTSEAPARLTGVRDTIAGTPASAQKVRARDTADPLRAYPDWEGACYKREGDACAEALRLLREGALGFYDGARSEGLARLACAYGETRACPTEGVPAGVGRPEVDLAPGRARAEAACAAGWSYGCRVVAEATLLGAQDRGALTHDATWTDAIQAAQAATTRACAAGDAWSCAVAPGFSCGTDDPVGCLLAGG